MTIYIALSYSFPSFEPASCSISGSNWCFLARMQFSQWTGKVVWYSHLFKNFSQFFVIHIVKGFRSEVKWSEVTQSCPTLCDPMDYSLQGSSVHGIFQARVLEWVAISFSKGFPTQGLNPGLPHCRQTLYCMNHQGSLKGFIVVPK